MSGLREFGESAARSVLERIGRGVSRVQERKPLPYDVLESDDAYLVVFDAPGTQRSDVQVRFLDGEVQVRIDRFRDFHEGFEMRFPGRGLSLDGSAELPDDAGVDATDASATLAANGTLRVEIPKDERAQDVTVTDESETDGAETDADADEFETDVDEDAAGESIDATDSATGVGATDTADGVGSVDSTDVDSENVDADVESADPDHDGDDEDEDEDEYEDGDSTLDR